jgi:hypothetical protein
MGCLGIAAADESSDLSAALDTADWGWTAPLEDGGKAVIVADAAANGGGKVVAGQRKLVARIPQAGYLKFRYKGLSLRGGQSGEEMRAFEDTVAPGDAGTGWKTKMLLAGRAGLADFSGRDLEIDSVSAIVPTVDLGGALGMPGVPLRFGDESPFYLSPRGDSALGYVVRTIVSTTAKNPWMEFDVEGPAKLNVVVNPASSTAWQVGIDGKFLWDTNSDGYQFTLELPSGRQKVRLTAGALFPLSAEQSAWAEIDQINVVPVAGSELGIRALELDGPLATSGAWGVREVAGAVNGTALRGIGPMAGNAVKTLVTGPCYVSYRSFLAPTPGKPETSLYFYSEPNGVAGHPGRKSSAGGGWAIQPDVNDPLRRKLWMPPGEHWIKWSCSALGSASEGIAIDQVVVTPSPSLTVGEGAGLADAEWVNDAKLPWSGYDRTHDGFRATASPMVADGGTSELALRLAGPGKLSYRWLGNGYVAAEVWVNDVKMYSSDTAGIDARTLDIPAGATSVVRWKVTNETGFSSWLDLYGVTWQPATPQERFNAWAAALPAGKRLPLQDADGDGFNNLLEYGFGSAAGDAGQIPGAIQASWSAGPRAEVAGPDGTRRGPGGLEIPADCVGFYDLKVPYVAGLTAGAVEYSADLVSWKSWPEPLLNARPAVSALDGWSGWPNHTEAHQSISIPVAAETKAGFFRVKMVLEN